MKKFFTIFTFILLFSCNQEMVDLKKIGEQYNEMVISSLEKVGSSFSANSQLDFFPFYYEGADISYQSSNESSLYVEGTALYLNRKDYVDEYAILTATLSLGKAMVSYQYALCILSTEMKMLTAPTVSLIREGKVVDGFYIEDFDFKEGDRLRLEPPIGSSCRYTLDGSQPTNETEEKDLTFDLSTGLDLNLKVIAVREGYFPSPVLNVTGFIPGKKPTLSVKGSNLTLKMEKSVITTAIDNDSNFVNLETLDNIREEAKPYYLKLKESPYFEEIQQNYYILNFLDLALPDYDWPAKDLKDKLFASSQPTTQEANVEDSTLFFYFVKKEGAFKEDANFDSAFIYTKIAVADMLPTPSEDLICPIFLTDSEDYTKRKLFDTKDYLQKRGLEEKFVSVDSTLTDPGYIDESIMDTILPGWGDLMFSLEQLTIVVKSKISGGDNLKTLFSFTAATEVDKYLATFYKGNNLGFEWRASSNQNNDNVHSNVYENATKFIIHTQQNNSNVLKIGNSSTQVTSYSSKNNTVSNNPTVIPYRAGGKLGKFSLGANNRFGLAVEKRWRGYGAFHCRVYQGVLTDTELQTVVTEMNDTDYPMEQ